ncbi:unnamed protein product [Paramecium octaurelia]|uniref:Aminotransferase class I/classII large domain-containing protein n=1 Tax=Paramecium octaurelia TaxID=43137 RepID=A0A8S1SMC7_PAROT|nr:unnamed protein product [Paramecium octaurelia]
MIKASEFLLSQNQALLANFSELKADPNHAKPMIQFMKGDPTEFGHEHCKMSQIGYDIVKSEIPKSQNHSYCHSTGTQPAKQAVAKHFGHGKNITENDVIITQGVNQGLFYCLLGICDPGQNILVPEIGFPFFDGIAQAYQVEVRKYKLQSDNNWQIDFEDLNSKLDANTKFLYVINPSNPCGSVFSKEHVQGIINWANQNHVLIVADEIYYGMSFGEFVSFGELADEGPIICLGGMDKIFFTPGWQVSWMIFYDKNHYADAIKQAMFNLCQLLLHANVFVMNSLPQILDQLTIFYARDRMLHFKENHDFLLQELNQIRGFKCIPAQGTIYLAVLIDLEVFKVKNDAEFAKKLLLDQNVMLLPLSWNGTDKYQGIRMLTIATKDVYIELIARLKEFVSRL